MKLSWKAGVHNQFKDKTISQLNKMSGKKSKNQGYNYNSNYNFDSANYNNFEKDFNSNKSILFLLMSYIHNS